MDKEYVNTLVNEYLEARHKYLAPRSVEQYKQDILAFGKWAIDNDLDFLSITKKHIHHWFDRLSVGPRMSNRKLSVVRTFFAFLNDYEYSDKSNPCENIKSLKIPKRFPRTLTASEIETILQVASRYGEWLVVLIKLLYYTGMRVSEALSLQTSDFNFDRHELRVIGKGNKERIVAFGGNLNQILEPYFATLTTKYLFLGEKDKSVKLNRVEYLFACLREKTGITIRPHILRHTFATESVRAGTSLTGVKVLLGHENISATEIYVHESSDIHEIYDKANKMRPNIL